MKTKLKIRKKERIQQAIVVFIFAVLVVISLTKPIPAHADTTAYINEKSSVKIAMSWSTPGAGFYYLSTDQKGHVGDPISDKYVTSLEVTANFTPKTLGKQEITLTLDISDNTAIPIAVKAKTVVVNVIERPPTTTKTTTKTTTQATTTTPTETTTTPSTTPEETKPYHPVETVVGYRYDEEALSLPESVPLDGTIPLSFEAAEVLWKDKHVTGYQSETLPYTLFWLAAEDGTEGFYLYDETLAVFVPYLRTEWSSRFYTFSMIPEQDIPEGFELHTLNIWGEDVPGYRAKNGHFLPKSFYDAYLENGVKEDELPPISEEPYLLALRMNDAEEVRLYFYDATLDSLIREELWIIPIVGSFLDREEPTTPPTEPLPTEPTIPSETTPETREGIVLFGLVIPTFYLAAGVGLLLLIVSLIVWLWWHARRAAKIEPELTLKDLKAEDESESDPIEEGVEAQDEILDPSTEPLSEAPEAPVLADPEDAWHALAAIVSEQEKRETSNGRTDMRLPGIRPATHLREGRDAPYDTDEL